MSEQTKWQGSLWPRTFLKNFATLILTSAQLIIVNLQRTPYDEAATLRVFSKTDLFMHLLMKHLGIETFDTEYDAITIMRQQIAAEERKRFIRKLIMGTVVGVAVAATAFALRGRFPVFGRNQ